MSTQPNNNPNNSISWHSWDESAFKMAQLTDKPILLMISAQWCYWCHVMLEDSYVDEGVVNHVNQNYIPILVDTDQRPEVNFRYNVGGWPTTAILTPHGGMLAGATYLTPDQLLSMLLEVTEAYQQDKPGLYDRSRELFLQHQQRASRVGLSQVSTEIEPRLLDRDLIDSIARMSIGTYDTLHGGFGYDLKFPNPHVISLMNYFFQQTKEPFYEVIIRKTLDALTTSAMSDSEEGGFFRYTKHRDWSDPQYEKLLDDNIALSSAFMSAGIALEDPGYIRFSLDTMQFLQGSLYDPKSRSYRGSIGADSAYYGMSPVIRSSMESPEPDPFSYISSTAKTVSLNIRAITAGLTPPLDASQLNIMLTQLYDQVSSGSSAHAFTSELTGGQTDLLIDLAAVIEALSLGIQNLIIPKLEWEPKVKSLVEILMETYYDERRGAFYDTPASKGQPGYMAIREKPLPDNIVAIKALMAYQNAAGITEYADAIRISLIAFLDVYGEYGEHSADFALLASQYLDDIGMDNISA